MPKFNEVLRSLRSSEQLSQQELANALKISKSSVNMYERGEREPGLETLEKIADFFNVSMDYLLGKEYAPKKKPIGERIREIRIEKELTQKDVATCVLFSEAEIEAIENGKRKITISEAQNIAHAMGVSLFELVSADDYCLREEDRLYYANLYTMYKGRPDELCNAEYNILEKNYGFPFNRDIAKTITVSFAPILYDEHYFSPEHIASLASELTSEQREAVVNFITKLLSPNPRKTIILDS